MQRRYEVESIGDVLFIIVGSSSVASSLYFAMFVVAFNFSWPGIPAIGVCVVGFAVAYTMTRKFDEFSSPEGLAASIACAVLGFLGCAQFVARSHVFSEFFFLMLCLIGGHLSGLHMRRKPV